MTIATAASLFTFNLEWVLHKTFHQRLLRDAEGSVHAVKQADPEAPPPATSTADTKDVPEAAECKVRLKTLQNMIRSYTFEAGIIFHSRFLPGACFVSA